MTKTKSLNRVLLISAMNGGSVACLGVIGVLISLVWGGWLGAFVCLLITVSGGMELTGRSRLKQGRREAGKLLKASQLWLFLVIVCYAGYQLWSFDRQDPLAIFSPELQEMLKTSLGPDSPGMGVLIAKAYDAVYISLIVAAFLYQGGLWLYYRKISLKASSVSENSRQE